MEAEFHRLDGSSNLPATERKGKKRGLFCCERTASLSSAAQINPLAPPLGHGFPAEAATSAGAVITPADETKTLPSVSGRRICCTSCCHLLVASLPYGRWSELRRGRCVSLSQSDAPTQTESKRSQKHQPAALTLLLAVQSPLTPATQEESSWKIS